jgi:hypothetical protein
MSKSINPTAVQEKPITCLNTFAFGPICSRAYAGCETEPCFKAENSFPECVNPQESTKTTIRKEKK